MKKIILDANILIAHWRRSRSKPLSLNNADDARKWALKLIELEQTNAILTPIYLEFIGGVVDRHEMVLSRAYMEQFRVMDDGAIRPEDWSKARQLAERIPQGIDPRPRGAIDCLIRAIALRLRFEVRTADRGMPRR